ncbi:outer membrane usher protein [Cupriavidus alkaliphilus]|nr:outer membrane usher protein [Cupriavidus alkaliphilus]
MRTVGALVPATALGWRSVAWRGAWLLLVSPHALAQPPSPDAPSLSLPAPLAAPHQVPGPGPDVAVAGPGAQTVYLAVSLNGVPRGLVARFELRDGMLATTPEELRQIGLRAEVLPVDGNGLVWLDAIPGLRVSYRQSSQEAALDAPDALLVPAIVGTLARPEARLSGGTGLVLSYDLYGETGRGRHVGLYSEQRVFHGQGVLSNSGVATWSEAQDRYVRLDTAWTYTDAATLSSVQVGDAISGALNWSRAVRLGGLQYRRNFTVRPDLVTYPVPLLGASAAVPSAVDLYVNNVRQFSGEVPSGPFVLNNTPAVNGAGQAVIVVRDALGRDISTTIPLYIDTRLLAAGLTDFSVEAGFLREDYGLRSAGYGRQPAGSASVRHGLSETLTLEGHAEAMPGTYTVGGGVLASAGGFGVFSAAASLGAGRERGALFSLGYQLRTPAITIDLQGIRTAATYQDLAARSGAPYPDGLYRATLSWPMARNGSLALSYVQLDDAQPGGSKIGSVAYTAQLGGRYSVNLSAYKDFGGNGGSGALVTLTAVLGHDTSASVAAGVDGGKASLYASAAQSTPYEGGWGWQAQASQTDGVRRYLAQARYRGRYGEMFAAAQSNERDVTGAVDVTGSVVVMDGAVLPARRINESFALVSTGMAGVPVLVESRRIGTTDGNGHYLVPDLMPYQANRVAIDPLVLPADARLDKPSQYVVPSWHAGALARFQVERFRGAQLSLVTPAGEPVAAGTPVVHVESGATSVVGYDGMVFFDNLAAHNHLVAGEAQQRCTASFSYRAAPAGSIPSLGRITCRGAQRGGPQ